MAEKAKRDKTTYHVLKRQLGARPEEGTLFELVGLNLQAHNAQAAIRDHAAAAGKDAGGTYVAVPSRSFEEVTVKVETTTVVKLGTT